MFQRKVDFSMFAQNQTVDFWVPPNAPSPNDPDRHTCVSSFLPPKDGLLKMVCRVFATPFCVCTRSSLRSPVRITCFHFSKKRIFGISTFFINIEMPPEKESKTEAEEVPKEEATTKVETKDDVSTKNDDMKKQKAKNEDKMEETDSNKDEEGTKKVDTKKDDKKNQEANDEDKMEIEETDSKKKQVGAKKVGTKKEEGTKKDDAKKQETNTENEEEGTDSDDEGSEEETNDGGRELGKRKRKSSVENAFEPLDFTMQGAKQVKIIKGRGKKLKGMPSVVASIESHSLEDVLFAHKFLFGNRGSTLKKKELTANLLEFSGYLKDAPKGYDKDKLEAEDELEEVRLSCFPSSVRKCILFCAHHHIDEVLEKSIQDGSGASKNALRLFRCAQSLRGRKAPQQG